MLRSLAVLLLGIAMGTSAAAQWLGYPTTGVPKTPSGLPNLGAPAPRTADGKPDLSGIWEAENTRPCPKDGCFDMHFADQFLDLGARIQGGLPYQPWAAKLVKERMKADGKDDTTTRCLPPGVPRMHALPFLRKLVQVPGLLVILDESDLNHRQIFMDGRPLPENPQPSWNGYSVGKWDGDTLVVETIGFRDGIWLDRNGSPLTTSAKVIERFHRINYGNMDIEITVDDPKAYTHPWTTMLKQYIVLNSELLETVCLDNEKDAQHLSTK